MSEFSDRIIGDLRQYAKYDSLLIQKLQEALEEEEGVNDVHWIHKVLDELCTGLRKEFAAEEAGGYLSEVLERFPTWERRVRKLQEDHKRLIEDLEALRRQIDNPAGDRKVSHELRAAFQDWLERLAEHKRRENELLLDSVNLDVGEGE